MTDSLSEAKRILAANGNGEKPARDFMTAEQRDALAEDFAARRHFLSAAHFHSNADKRKEFEGLADEKYKRK